MFFYKSNNSNLPSRLFYLREKQLLILPDNQPYAKVNPDNGMLTEYLTDIPLNLYLADGCDAKILDFDKIEVYYTDYIIAPHRN